ncbi:MAG: hypothetical protein IT290_03375 [Deltaproteobacteria bacterium]|nr:hypothetical protein [Deltaproteobacteria bacterium]
MMCSLGLRSEPLRFSGLMLLLVVVTIVCRVDAIAQPSAQPRIQQSDIQYLGAFLFPSGTNGTSRFGYGGRAPTYFVDSSNRETLIAGGHDWYHGHVAQVQIPQIVNTRNVAQMQRATWLQPFADITEGRLTGLSGDRLGSLLVVGSKLLVGSYTYYDGNGTQQFTIGDSGMTTATTGDFRGFFAPTGINPGRLGRYMTYIPSEWRSSLGGDALNGACCLAVIGRTSAGPSASVFQTSSVGSANPVPFKEVVGYPLGNPIRYQGQQGSCEIQSSVWNCTTTVDAVAFPSGSRSVLFFGSQGTGPICYKDTGPVGCRGTGGYWAPPFATQVWAYDANELVAVKNGSRTAESLEPYAIWTFNVQINIARYNGATYDPGTRRVFMVEENGEDPIVHVFKINGGTGDSLAPSAPSSMRSLP